MPEQTSDRCRLCRKQPAPHGLRVLEERASYPLCDACLMWSSAFDRLLDAIGKHRHSAEEIRETARLLLHELGQRCQSQVVAAFKQTLAEYGVPL